MCAFYSIIKLLPVSTLSRPKLKQIWHRPFWKTWLPIVALTVYETEIIGVVDVFVIGIPLTKSRPWEKSCTVPISMRTCGTVPIVMVLCLAARNSAIKQLDYELEISIAW